MLATQADVPSYRLRIATPDDAAIVAEFSARLFYETFAADNTPDDMRLYMASAFGEAIQRRQLEDANVTYLLMEFSQSADKPMIGAMALLQNGSTDPAVRGEAPIEIQRFYVDQQFHGRGVAGAMMAACLTQAADIGGQTCWLGVWEKNPRAIRFYEKCGFVDVGTHIFHVGTDAQTDRIMMRSV